MTTNKPKRLQAGRDVDKIQDLPEYLLNIVPDEKRAEALALEKELNAFCWEQLYPMLERAVKLQEELDTVTKAFDQRLLSQVDIDEDARADVADEIWKVTASLSGSWKIGLRPSQIAEITRAADTLEAGKKFAKWVADEYPFRD